MRVDLIWEFQKHKPWQEKTNKKIITKNKSKTTRGRENERKMYFKLVTCWIAYMYNVALNIKAPVHTNLDISEATHFLHHKTAFPQHWTSESAHSSASYSCKKIVVSKKIRIRVDWSHKLVPEGLGNCSFDLLAELCSDISSTKRDLSLTFKKSTRNNCYYR